MGTTPTPKQASSVHLSPRIKLTILRPPTPPPAVTPYAIAVVPPPHPIIEEKTEPAVEPNNFHVRRRKFVWQPSPHPEPSGKVQRINVNATSMITSREVKSALVTPMHSPEPSPKKQAMKTFTETVRKELRGVTVKEAALAMVEEKLPLIYQRSSAALSRAKALKRTETKFKLNVPRKMSEGVEALIRESSGQEHMLRKVKSFNMAYASTRKATQAIRLDAVATLRTSPSSPVAKSDEVTPTVPEASPASAAKQNLLRTSFMVVKKAKRSTM